jgi:hypothetical protein
MLRYLSDDYLQIVHIHYRTVAIWNKNLLACIGHLMSVIAKCYWFDEKNGTQMKILFPTEKITCNHVEELIRILAHKPYHAEIKAVRSNDETVLIDSILMILINIIQIENINWFFRSNAAIQDALLMVAETSLYDEICLRAYTILGEILTDEQLKELNIADRMADFLFKMLEQAWQHPSKEYKQIRIEYLLKGKCINRKNEQIIFDLSVDFQTLSKNDSIQQTTANLTKIPLLTDICEQYSTVYYILWTLSFNRDIQQQLRSSSSFMSKLLHLAKDCDDEKMRKIIHGILWNLEIDHENRRRIITFDIMISYSHKDKELCKKIYEKLVQSGYRVWIDYDQMHGNIMDAMAQAIERSHTVIICMSEDYRKSNYCRAEAHYAFQRQLKIVPILLQKYYRPDGWLVFLLGQLLYVDFTKYEFNRAIDILKKELQAGNNSEIDAIPVCPSDDTDTLLSITSTARSQNILEWTQAQVQDWCMEHNLSQVCHILTDCDGRSLFYLSKYMKHGDLRQILFSLQEDSLRRTNQSLSFLELSRFQSLMDQYHSDN